MLKILSCYVEIADSHQTRRASFCIGLLFQLIEETLEQRDEPDIIYNFLEELLKDFPSIRNSLWANFQTWSPWIYELNVKSMPLFFVFCFYTGLIF